MTKGIIPTMAAASALALCAAAPPPATPHVAAPMSLPANPVVKPVALASARPPRAHVLVQRHIGHRVAASPRVADNRVAATPRVADIGLASRAATQEPSAHGFVNATAVYPYADGMIFHVYAAPGQVTDLALQPGEALGSVASGDTVRWVIGDTTSGTGDTKRAHILVKPFSAGLATNLVVTTDRRTYHIALTSITRTAMASLSWTYPQDDLIALKKASEQQAAAMPVASDLAIDNLHFDYVLSGDQPAWRPLRAFDDGRQTFIEFPAAMTTSDAPPLFLVDPKGNAELVNYRLSGRYYIVDRLFDFAELRLGAKHQQIVRISRSDAAIDDKRWRRS
jgi:P-type conjugative transfer protein TrbG